MEPIQPTKTLHKKPYQAIDPQRPELSQKGRTVLVTGGAAGIGFAIVRAFIAASAARIIIVGRRSSKIDESIAELQQLPGADRTTLSKRVCDVSDADAAAKLWGDLAEEGVVVDTMVINAASISNAGSVLDRGAAEVWRDFTTNVCAMMDFTDRFHKQPGKGSFNKKVCMYMKEIARQERS